MRWAGLPSHPLCSQGKGRGCSLAKGRGRQECGGERRSDHQLYLWAALHSTRPDRRLLRSSAVEFCSGTDRRVAPFVSSYARSSPHPSALFRPCLRSSERVSVRSAPSASRAPGNDFDGTEQAGTRSNGRKQGRNSADGAVRTGRWTSLLGGHNRPGMGSIGDTITAERRSTLRLPVCWTTRNVRSREMTAQSHCLMCISLSLLNRKRESPSPRFGFAPFYS